MFLSQKFSQPLVARAVLLSIKPKYSEIIISGVKRVEFRRIWAKEPVSVIAIYASSPIQRIVGVVEVESYLFESSKNLWEISKSKSGGLTRQELRSYFQGRSKGYALLLGAVHVFERPVDPRLIFEKFSAPQSFRYLSSDELNCLLNNSVVDKG